MKPASASASLFEVYLRLRPSQNVNGERFIDVEEPVAAATTVTPVGSYDGYNRNDDNNYSQDDDVDGNKDECDGGKNGGADGTGQENGMEASERPQQQQQQQQPIPTHITIKPPSYDHRKRAVERFAFTRVFEEDASQRDVFTRAGVVPLITGVLGGGGGVGEDSVGSSDGRQKKQMKGARDGLLATLGMTGSGKTHTILGSKSQRGLTQMALDVLFQSTGDCVLSSTTAVQAEFESLVASDPSEAIMVPSVSLLDSTSGDIGSRFASDLRGQSFCPDMSSFLTIPTPKRRTKHLLRRSAMPSVPSVHDITVPTDPSIAQYAIVVSMYEVYNDRIFDLLGRQPGGTNAPSTPNNNNHHHHQNHNQRRRHLLFKFTEASPDRKVVAGLRKVVCSSLEEALTVLDTGLLTRKVAGTGSNAVSSRGHGFFVVEVKRRRNEQSNWTTGTLTIVDLAGSERARNAKTAGATLAEAGKINESLMYLGQCMQMQSDSQELGGGGGGGGNGSRNIAVPYRQCKLTELLFSNSFVNTNAMTSTNHQGYRSSQYYGGGGIYGQQQQQQQQHQQQQRIPQRAIMIVTADARGDFNATSQILRYSALAREVTVPRIPSVSSVIQNGGGGRASPIDIAYPNIVIANDKTLTNHHAILSPSPYSSPSSPTDSQHPYSSLQSIISPVESESEISNANAILRLQLTDETTRRRAAESSWLAAEQRLADAEERLAATEDQLAAAEQAVRDEMCVLLEEAVEAERRRWKGVWDEELERQDEKVDRKIEIMERRGGRGSDDVDDDDDDDDCIAANAVFNGNGNGNGNGDRHPHARAHALVDIFVDAHDHDHRTEEKGAPAPVSADTATATASATVTATAPAAAAAAAAAATAATTAITIEHRKIAALEQENDGLKVKVRALERAALNDGYDVSCNDNDSDHQRQQQRQQQRQHQPRTPSRKQRVLTARRWEADCGLGSSP